MLATLHLLLAFALLHFLGKGVELLFMGLLLIVQAADRGIHIDCETDQDVHANQDGDDVEGNEVEQDPFRATRDLDIHLCCDHPVVNHNEFEQDQVSVGHVIEVVKCPVIRSGIISLDFFS